MRTNTKMSDNEDRVLQRNHFVLLVTAMFVVGDVGACRTSSDPFYDNGLVVDCSNQGLTPQAVKNLNVPGMTTLILSHNDIHVLENNSFVQHGGLKKLMCESCNMRYVEVDALKGLDKLEVLGLQSNELSISDHVFPRGLFQHVPNLKTLKISDNGDLGRASNYSEFIDIFDSLPALEELSIDSFSTLTIGGEFVKLTHLKSLDIVNNNLQSISGNSFEGFQESNVKRLILREAKLFDTQIDTMAFQFLPNISFLGLYDFHIGNMNALKMMEPLQGRVIDEIFFDSLLYHTVRDPRILVREGTFQPNNTKFLTNIYVSNFTWIGNKAVSVESGAFISDVWTTCLKSFWFVSDGTSPYVDIILLYRLLRFKLIETFVIMKDPNRSIRQDIMNREGDKKQVDTHNDSTSSPIHPFSSTPGPTEVKGKLHWKDSHNFRSYGDYKPSQPRPEMSLKRKTAFTTRLTSSATPGYNIKNLNSISLKPNKDAFKRYSQVGVQKRIAIERLRLPPHLNSLVFEGFGILTIDNDVEMLDNKVRVFYYRNAHPVAMRARWLGLNHLATIDFSGTKISLDSNPGFFQWFPSLTKLVLKNTRKHKDSVFYSKVAENVPTLEYYDISSNDLVWLPDKTFSYNKQLKYLNLADNRFSDIPFDLSLTPNLKILDLQGNSLNDLSHEQRPEIEKHIRIQHGMTLLLDSNPFSCTCSSLPFLKWLLQTTAVSFDRGANYSCFSEEGTQSYTASFSDIKSFWRQCQGRYYFLISLTLAFTLATLYLGAYLGTTHKTQIISKVMQLVSHDFRLQTRRDFVYDVCVGYADQDGDYVRHTLLRYLESMWNLRTFVHQRDLLHDPLMMSHAIRASWRNVLLITKNFLDEHAMAHNVMKVSTFFVSPSNPRSVVVMVEESVRHRVPDYVLQVVHEDNIIVLPGLQSFLHYEAKETLKDRILR